MEYIDGVPLDQARAALSLHNKVQVIRDAESGGAWRGRDCIIISNSELMLFGQ